MRNAILTLTEREKETLRLLLKGHDAKSIARDLGLSVHTINERLRDARRKLGVSSSREAARLLAEAEAGAPNSLGDNALGVLGEATDVPSSGQASRPHRVGHRLAWFGGGMLIMSFLIAAVALSSVFRGSTAPGAQASAPAAPVASASASAGLERARTWLALVDRQAWDESWNTAATLFKAKLSAAQWSSMVQAVRQPLGAVSSRTFKSVTKANSIPGAPAGEYETLEFQTDFANRSGATETVVLFREVDGWKVTGYFIR
ncbi:DUF4019 domain-containing protein [Sphingomonas sp. IC-56]|uniref:helix-turn-helix domain-containing protein n=1 Tax=Sphingomonas sp. IC-56 TaxID=2898529 RepID=UPI001E50C612|nr:DUF4019 domain-containing protein [Sphingomonas sp. IC-56]MCD2323203.1 DUF4019 domain-containing protein [Sphingomonas sp. IC-56]